MNENPNPKEQIPAQPAVGSSALLGGFFLLFVASICHSIVIFRLQTRGQIQSKAITALQEQLSHLQSVSIRRYGEYHQPSALFRTVQPANAVVPRIPFWIVDAPVRHTLPLGVAEDNQTQSTDLTYRPKTRGNLPCASKQPSLPVSDGAADADNKPNCSPPFAPPAP